MLKKKKVILFQPLNALPYFGNSLEPLGLELLASFLEENGYETIILPTDTAKNELLSIIEKERPFAIGFSVHSYVYETCLEMAKEIKNISKKWKNSNIKIIFGGYHPSACPEEVASHEDIDYVIEGEGEITLKELLNALSNKIDHPDIPGLIYKNNNIANKNSKRDRIKDLDVLPFAKRSKEILNIKNSNSIIFPSEKKLQSVARIMYGRGCPFGCYFCQSKNLTGREVFWRSPPNVLDEVEELIKNFKVNYLGFVDSTLNLNKKRLLALCKEFIKRDLPVYWNANIRADRLDEEQLVALKEAKCTKICVGLESPVLDYAKKIKGSYNPEEQRLIKTLKLTNNLGFIIRVYAAIGFPFESKEMILSYPEKWEKFSFDEILIAFATPLPGTDFFADCVKNYCLSEPIQWSSFNYETPSIDRKNLSKDQLVDLKNHLYMKIYLSDHYLTHLKTKLTKSPVLAYSWDAHLNNFKKLNLSLKNKKKFENLIKMINTFK